MQDVPVRVSPIPKSFLYVCCRNCKVCCRNVGPYHDGVGDPFRPRVDQSRLGHREILALRNSIIHISYSSVLKRSSWGNPTTIKNALQPFRNGWSSLDEDF